MMHAHGKKHPHGVRIGESAGLVCAWMLGAYFVVKIRSTNDRVQVLYMIYKSKAQLYKKDSIE